MCNLFNLGIVTCGPNEALIISGVCYGGAPNAIVGGRALVCPCLQVTNFHQGKYYKKQQWLLLFDCCLPIFLN